MSGTSKGGSMALPFMPFSPPKVSERGKQLVERALSSYWLGTGPLTKEFEAKFADYVGAKHAVAVSSCTSGTFLTLKALNIGPGDEVITTAMTFCSTVNSILHCGATPVLADVDPEFGNISVEEIERLITDRTVAILPVHYAGAPCDIAAITELASKHSLYVIEDAAHSVEGLSNERSTGTFGVAGVYSFYATKNLAIGEGGMVVTDDSDLAHRIATLSLHGLSRGAWTRFSGSGRRTYDIEEIGYKANFTDIQAAIGLSQLEELGDNLLRRMDIWDFYDAELSETSLTLPKVGSDLGSRHARHLYVALLPPGLNRDDLIQRLADEYSLAFGVHYQAIPSFPIYQKVLGVKPSDFPVAKDWGDRCLSLSLSPGMTYEHCQRVVTSLKDCLP